MARDEKSGHDGLLDMEKELTCSICTDVLYLPLTLLDCLHTFCGSCLKEWFAWQATAAAQSRRTTHPYTCPSCRDPVRGTKADWRLTTLLEGFLKANPDKGKTEEEMEEMRRHYKPGEDVLPKVAVNRDEYDSEDERLLAQVRDMSMAEVGGGRARRRVERAAGSEGRRRTNNGTSPQVQPLSEARLRQHDGGRQHVEHQPSLRSLLSASSIDAGDVQQQIMQSIYSEGLLDGIDIDNLTPEQEEELTERIAEAYRRRQRRRDRSGNRDRHQRGGQSPQTQANTEVHHHARTIDTAEQQTQSRVRPPISRPHVFEPTALDTPQNYRKTPSSTTQRSSQRSTSGPIPATQAARSATDLSLQAPTGVSDLERHRRLSSNTRRTTDPADENSRADMSRMRANSSNARQESTASRPVITSVSHPLETVRQQTGPHNNSSPSLLPAPIVVPSHQQTVRHAVSTSAFAPEPISNLDSVQPIPSVTCNRCQKQNIQYDLHYHCSVCRNGTYNLCLSCYRDGQGCDHWFGFGYMAYERYRRLAPPEGWPIGHERPHVLSARRYHHPPSQTPGSITNRESPPKTDERLDEGAFCEMCFAFADDCYWYCYYCLEGAWGFCNACVQRGRHCTHPLLPVGHLNTLRHLQHHDPAKARLAQLPHLRPDSYVALPALTDCDLCRRPISPHSTRFHCYACSGGDYDVCAECYHGLVATGRIPAADGPNGWRKCLHGHRMALLGYQDTPDGGGGQQRITVRDPLGGWRHRDDDGPPPPDPGVGPAVNPALPPSDSSLGIRALALWSRFPAAGVTDELLFPKNAEIREVEDRNADWCLGVYAGAVGLFPSNHVKKL